MLMLGDSFKLHVGLTQMDKTKYYHQLLEVLLMLKSGTLCHNQAVKRHVKVVIKL